MRHRSIAPLRRPRPPLTGSIPRTASIHRHGPLTAPLPLPDLAPPLPTGSPALTLPAMRNRVLPNGNGRNQQPVLRRPGSPIPLLNGCTTPIDRLRPITHRHRFAFGPIPRLPHGFLNRPPVPPIHDRLITTPAPLGIDRRLPQPRPGLIAQPDPITRHRFVTRRSLVVRPGIVTRAGLVTRQRLVARHEFVVRRSLVARRGLLMRKALITRGRRITRG
ncbi:hypothetical protein GL307_34335 [Nocardia seriolae]|uniref:hypothetical protein n=1 Tax=Nocardia seriolae TaxID=37332 RepID=UPI0012BB9430|nr:hypothetical protein [Nocardia seriolae]MTL16448.1 hypothetical protein [Nocardia seriolae]